MKETWSFDCFVSSLYKDKKLTWLIVIFIEKESAKKACKFTVNLKMDKFQLNKKFCM